MLQRDYSTISPSAKGLLIMKSLTEIPFIREASRLIWGAAATNSVKERLHDNLFLARLLHFEHRYWSINEVLQHYPVKNIIELSSGFSFRGLSMTMQDPELTYVDTDLPEVIATKLGIIDDIITENQIESAENLYIQPLNALDADTFKQIVDQLPGGPVTIINEGLLVYLNRDEKVQLCNIIRNILIERGGQWVTGDVYIKKETLNYRDQFSDFLKQHNVEENKFESFGEAEEFFKVNGLKINRVAASAGDKLSALKYLDQNLMQAYGDKESMQKMRIRQTWALVPA